MSNRYIHLNCLTCDAKESMYVDSSNIDLFTIQDEFLEMQCDECRAAGRVPVKIPERDIRDQYIEDVEAQLATLTAERDALARVLKVVCDGAVVLDGTCYVNGVAIYADDFGDDENAPGDFDLLRQLIEEDK